MSETFDGNNGEHGSALLSLARWRDPEEEKPAPADTAEARRPRRAEVASEQPAMSPLLAGLASGAQPSTRALATLDTDRSALSVADVLRRRGEALARRLAVQPVDDIAPPEPEILPPPRRGELPRSRRLDLPRVDRGPEFRVPIPEVDARPLRSERKAEEKRQQTGDAAAAGDVGAKSKPRNSRRGGLFGAVAKLMGRGKAKAVGAGIIPTEPARATLSRRSRKPREVSPTVAENTPVQVAGDAPPAAAGRTKGSPTQVSPPPRTGDLMSIIRRTNANPNAAAVAEAAAVNRENRPASPPAAPVAHPDHPPASHYPPAPMHPLSMHSAPMPVAATPAAPVWPAAMPMPSMPPIHPAPPAFYPPMAQPVSAYFYWPQPIVPPHWAYAGPYVPLGWQAPASPPAAPFAHVQPASVAEAPARPSAANDAPPYPVHSAPASADPLSAEIDEVRERLRLFGEALHELHRTRASRQLG